MSLLFSKSFHGENSFSGNVMISDETFDFDLFYVYLFFNFFKDEFFSGYWAAKRKCIKHVLHSEI